MIFTLKIEFYFTKQLIGLLKDNINYTHMSLCVRMCVYNRLVTKK